MSYFLSEADALEVSAIVIDGLTISMEEMDPAREKGGLVDAVRGPLSTSVEALERRNVGLPTGQDFHFYNNFQEFKRPVADIQTRVVALLSQLGSLKDVIPHPAEFPADVDEGYDWFVRVQDAVLERVDASLDKFYLERKAESRLWPGVSSTQNTFMKTPRSASDGTKSRDVKVARSSEKLRSPIPFHIPSIPRPQDKFDDAVDNSNTPFRHKAVKGRIQMQSAATTSQETGPLSGLSSVISNLSVVEAHARKLGHKDPTENIHPLQVELTEMAYVEGLLDKVEVRKYESLDDTPFTLVTTPKVLKKMAAKLRAAGEVAIDLENHHYRSYQGFVCLMQLSTRDEDFIVDTLDLRSEIGPCLGDIFGDPAIKKVMHGADRDIVWLQRDFGIYVCNLFDTGQAARVLELPGFGLGFLLEQFCGVHADKRYQLADWRIRPLPAEMTKYAREDTHYLLYLHDMLKQLLLDARANKKTDEDDPLLQVHKRSRDLCLQLYAKEIYTETSYQHIYGVHEKKFRPEQLAVVGALYSWRDSIARKEDESTGYVMPNHLLLQLASEMPDDVRQLQSFVKGSHSYVSRNATTVIEIIRQSKEKALREMQESQCELEEGELAGESPREELGSDEINIKGSKVGNALTTKETVLEAASKGEDQDGKMETSFSKKLQIDNLINPIEARTSGRMSGSDSSASETTGSDKAGDSLTDTRPGEGQSKLKSEILTGPVVVSRRTSSSLFGRKRVKTSSVYLPSSNVPVSEEPSGISAAQDLPATILKDPDSSLHKTGQAMSDTFTAEHGDSKSLDGGQISQQGLEITVSKAAARIAVKSLEIQAAGAISSATMEAVDRARDTPFTVPEASASAVIKRVSESTPIIVAKKKPSKLGSLLAGRKRVHQTVPSEFAMAVIQAKIKTHDIESSIVLPFGTPVMSLPDISITNAQQPAQGDVKAITVLEQRTDDCSKSLQEIGRSFDDETPERPACSTATQLPEVIMFEADEVGQRMGPYTSQAVIGGQNSEKHQTWWPPAAGKSGHRGSDSARDASSDQRDGDSPEVPMSLSEMHRNSKRGKKNRLHSEASFDKVDPDVPGGDFATTGSSSRKKKRRKEDFVVLEVDAEVKRVASTENNVHFKSYNYREARNVLRLGNMYTEKAGDTQGSKRWGRGRGSKKGSDSSGIPLSRTAFDPLRRAREDPRPEGVRAGQRRQVFPQTGNRTAVFKQ